MNIAGEMIGRVRARASQQAEVEQGRGLGFWVHLFSFFALRVMHDYSIISVLLMLVGSIEYLDFRLFINFKLL